MDPNTLTVNLHLCIFMTFMTILMSKLTNKCLLMHKDTQSTRDVGKLWRREDAHKSARSNTTRYYGERLGHNSIGCNIPATNYYRTWLPNQTKRRIVCLFNILVLFWNCNTVNLKVSSNDLHGIKIAAKKIVFYYIKRTNINKIENFFYLTCLLKYGCLF